MNKFSKYLISISLATVFTIATPLTTYTTVAHANESTAPVMEQQDQTNLGSQNIIAVSWYQNSAEAKALYLQGYNSAKVQEYQRKSLKKIKANINLQSHLI